LLSSMKGRLAPWRLAFFGSAPSRLNYRDEASQKRYFFYPPPSPLLSYAGVIFAQPAGSNLLSPVLPALQHFGSTSTFCKSLPPYTTVAPVFLTFSNDSGFDGRRPPAFSSVFFPLHHPYRNWVSVAMINSHTDSSA